MASRASPIVLALLIASLLDPVRPQATEARGVRDVSVSVVGDVRQLRNKAKDRDDTIFETVDFEVDEGVCGSLSAVKSRLESAFLAFFEAEFEDCGSDRDVQSLVLVDFKEAAACKGSKHVRRALESRELQRRQRGRGRFNRRSTCRDCRRRLEGVIGQNERFYGPMRALGKKSKGSKGHSKGSKGSSKGPSNGSSKGSSKGSKTQRSTPGCDANLVEELQNVGFRDVEEAEITKIKRVHCSSNNRNCKSTDPKRGACCGVDGCACNVPSESLCEAEDCCIEAAHPFDPEFCADFCDTSKCEAD